MRINDLYKKVGEFESALSQDMKIKSNCKNGCSRCCYVDLSVFEVEAENIRRWFEQLSPEEKNLLKQKWKDPLNETMNFEQTLTRSCAFLHNESCTVYLARPLICRTQGMALKFKHDENEFLDICPLNDDLIPGINDKDILNLDLLNLILVQLEKLDGGENERKRVCLSDLRQSLLDA